MRHIAPSCLVVVGLLFSAGCQGEDPAASEVTYGQYEGETVDKPVATGAVGATTEQPATTDNRADSSLNPGTSALGGAKRSAQNIKNTLEDRDRALAEEADKLFRGDK